MDCKVSMDDAVHAEKLSEQDEEQLEIERLAEKLMSRIEVKVAELLYIYGYDNLTRADVNTLCCTEEFNDVFYKMAESIINKQ